MGSGNSKGKEHQRAAKYGQIFLRTDRSTYFTGDTVTGKIYLSVISPYLGNQLFIKLKGKEVVYLLDHKQIESPITNGNTHKQTAQSVNRGGPMFEDKYEIVKSIKLLHTFPVKMLDPDQYAIPFSFMIPHNLPSTFHQEGNGYLANISYQIEAFLQPSNLRNDPRIKFKQGLVLKQRMKNATEGLNNQKRTEISSCCMSSGSNQLNVRFEKNYYCSNDTVRASVHLDNSKSKTTNRKIILQLKQRLKLTAKHIVWSPVLTKCIREMPGVSANNSSTWNQADLQVPPTQASESFKKLKKGDMKSYLQNLQVRYPVLNSTTKGKLITSEYFLEVSCPMDGCCTETPSVSCPIEVFYPELELPKFEMPMGWNPQEIGVVNLAFGSGPANIMTTNQMMIMPRPSVNQQSMVTSQLPAPDQFLANSQMRASNHHMTFQSQQPNQGFLGQPMVSDPMRMSNQGLYQQPNGNNPMMYSSVPTSQQMINGPMVQQPMPSQVMGWDNMPQQNMQPLGGAGYYTPGISQGF